MSDMKKAIAKPVAKLAEVKAEVAKAETTKAIASKVEAVKEEVKAAAPVAKETVAKAEKAVKKTAAKTATAAKKTVKKETAKVAKAAKATTKKATTNVHIQFAGKSYTNEDLINIMKDVWTYDLNQKEADLKNVELYVKPEENAVYYVVNGEISGRFTI